MKPAPPDKYEAVTLGGNKQHCYRLLPLLHFGAKWAIGAPRFVLYTPSIWVFCSIYGCSRIWANSEGGYKLFWGRRAAHRIWWRRLCSILVANYLIQTPQLGNRCFFCYFYQTSKKCFWEYFHYNFSVWESHSSNKHHRLCCRMPATCAGRFPF